MTENEKQSPGKKAGAEGTPSYSSSSKVRLSREMLVLDITMIGVGAMIGAGIFVLTGIAAGVAGPASFSYFCSTESLRFLPRRLTRNSVRRSTARAAVISTSRLG